MDTKVCDYCKNDFPVWNYLIDRIRFCSPSCRKMLPRNRNPMREETKEKIRITAVERGNRVYTPELRAKMSVIKKEQYENGLVPWNKGKTDIYSEITKASMASNKGMYGELSHNWQGGITPLIRAVRNCFRYRQWHSDCLIRDDYYCQKCGKRGGTLNVDHYPKSFSQIFFDNNLETMEEALNCEELWNINNGRTLCIECHKETDTYLKRLCHQYHI